MRSPDINQLTKGIRAGNRALLAQAITLIESHAVTHRAPAHQLLENLLPYSGQSVRLGISGVPGVGKSTFIENLGQLLVSQKHRPAVLAVDPSSDHTGGSILGDKTRMLKLAANKNCFVRPSPTSGSLGGVASKTREAMILCEAAGYDTIIVETVGVGQSEITVANMVDLFVLLTLPLAGDDLQGIKKGITEVADLIVVNKADAFSASDLRLAANHYRQSFSILDAPNPNRRRSVKIASGLQGDGMAEIWEFLHSSYRSMELEGLLDQKRSDQNIAWMGNEFDRLLKIFVRNDPHMSAIQHEITTLLGNGLLTPTIAAERMLQALVSDRRTGIKSFY